MVVFILDHPFPVSCVVFWHLLFFQKLDCDISGKLSPKEQFAMNVKVFWRQFAWNVSLFSGKKKKNNILKIGHWDHNYVDLLHT